MPLPNDIGWIIEPVITVFNRELRQKMFNHLVKVYISGSAEMVQYGTTKGGKPIFFEGPPTQQAIEYATKHCATLVVNLDNETKKRLAQVIADGIENKRGIPGIARDLRSQFEEMYAYKGRAEVIARTETCDALEQAFMDRADELGYDAKEWVTFDPCDICAGNEEEGVVPLDHVYSSGHVRPPAHPNCRCALAPALLGKTKESLKEGGAGSGFFGHAGRPGELGGSTGEGGGEEDREKAGSKLSTRADRAKASHVTSTQAVQRQAEDNEPKVAAATKGKQSGDNDPFDVIAGENAVEVKTIVRGKNDKITMHPPSLEKKMAFAGAAGLRTHTVVFDDRVGKVYYKEGVGSFRLSSMQEVTIDQLGELIK